MGTINIQLLWKYMHWFLSFCCVCHIWYLRLETVLDAVSAMTLKQWELLSPGTSGSLVTILFAVQVPSCFSSSVDTPSDPLPLHDPFSWPSITHTLWQGVLRLPWAMLVPCYSSPQSRSISNPAWQQMPAASKQFLEPEHLTSHGLGLILLWFSGNRFALAKDGKATNHHASHCLSSPLLKLFSGSTSDPLPLHDHLLWPSPSQTLWPGVPRLPKLLLFLFSSPGIAQS
jgi:hypothetical protein